ncbi:hypothetical protein [Arsenicicoccus sp. oral taxon 190]|uniref:hypothetical protein n=1 Tax=Arsenicicoccus sp. oral taxon 190 TaxID=1658671 RepID=UPI00067A313A|nr:hypothetical protein [Arsenicicoccus sp. oral taxon 190]AKT52101.1 hypothetical protein ADJ73_13905 [Arsenicicoccus sp. oral taxon 190]
MRVRAVAAVMIGALAVVVWLSGGMRAGTVPAWQVLGCGATVVTVTVLASWQRRAGVAVRTVAVPMALGATAAWTALAHGDETGLYLVGMLIMAMISLAGLCLVAVLTASSTAGRRA